MNSKQLLLTAAMLLISQNVMAEEAMQQAPQAMPAAEAPALPPITNDANLDAGLRALQNEWAVIKYQVKDEDKQTAQIKVLAKKAKQLSANHPNYAEPKIWQAIILSTQAGIDGGLGSLGLVKEAKSLLEQAQKLNPNALDGSAYTSLGSLYYKVPAWPIGFGDDEKAKANLEQARSINPHGIDPNYFYGDFLIEQGEYEKALPVLEHALQAQPRPGREIADAGRRAEIQADIALAHKKLGK